ncbi:MAG: hypothetical protein JWM32_1960 [Verrucomicrobia bacterium]|nr:hypothetical protein [Verrucomicrobiota bacterium]
MRAPLPTDEPGRQAALDRYHVMESGADRSLDDLAKLAAFICRSPIAAITLISHDRQLIRGKIGIEVEQSTRDDAFCAHTILANEVMVVEDAGLDERFRDNPAVTGNPHVRFYAGAPLVTPDNFKLGALCVIDSKPRKLTPEETGALVRLSRTVMTELELRRSAADLARALLDIRTLGELIPICSYCKDIRDDKGFWSRVEEYVGTRTGSDFSHGLCPKCAKVHFPGLTIPRK